MGKTLLALTDVAESDGKKWKFHLKGQKGKKLYFRDLGVVSKLIFSFAKRKRMLDALQSIFILAKSNFSVVIVHVHVLFSKQSMHRRFS